MSRIFSPKLFTLSKNGISKNQIKTDILSGIIVGIVALPLGIAFAVASGVSPERGLITSIFGGFLISFLGGSRVQIGGPTGAFIVVIYGIVESYGYNGLIISTVLAGLILVVFGLFKLGSLLKYIPHPLVVGFTTGIAVIIFSTQIKDALGLDIQSVPPAFLDKWSLYIKNIKTVNISAMLTTLATIIVILLSNKYIKKIHGYFVAIILITLVVHLFNIPVFTIESFFGDISNNISFNLPEFKLSSIPVYFKPALTLAFLGSIVSLLSAVVTDGMIGGNHRSNTELIAQGIANIVTPFFGGIPVTGAIARTATNVKNGGRTPIAGIAHSITMLLIFLFLGKWAKLIPMSCLAGILIIVSYNMSEWRTFLTIIKTSTFDAAVLIITFLLTILVNLTTAIEVGIVLSSLLFLKRMADSWKIVYEDSDTDKIDSYKDLPNGVGVYEIYGPLFFATVKEYIEVIRNNDKNLKTLIIRFRHVPFIDSTGLHNLKDVLHLLSKKGINTHLSDVPESVKSDLLKHKIIDPDKILDRFPY